MNWYLEVLLDSPVVYSSSVKLSRNIENYPFNIQSLADFTKIEKILKDSIYDIDDKLTYINLNNLDDVTYNSFVEKGLIDKSFNKDTLKSIIISDDEEILIEVNGNDHLAIIAFSPNMDLNRLYNNVNIIEQKLAKIFKFSYSNKYGYLTQSIQNVGTGLNAKISLFLPALTLTNNISEVKNICSSFRVKVYEKDEDIYVLENMQTLGKSCEQILDNLSNVANKIIEQEKIARKKLETKPIQLEDKLSRSFGILANSKTITNKETKQLLKDVRFATKLGIIPNVTDLMINKISLYSNPNVLKKYLKENLTQEELDLKRAILIKDILNGKI